MYVFFLIPHQNMSIAQILKRNFVMFPKSLFMICILHLLQGNEWLKACDDLEGLNVDGDEINNNL